MDRDTLAVVVAIVVAVGKDRWGHYRTLLVDRYIVGVGHIPLDIRPDNLVPELGSQDKDGADSAVYAGHNCRHSSDSDWCRKTHCDVGDVVVAVVEVEPVSAGEDENFEFHCRNLQDTVDTAATDEMRTAFADAVVAGAAAVVAICCSCNLDFVDVSSTMKSAQKVSQKEQFRQVGLP